MEGLYQRFLLHLNVADNAYRTKYVYEELRFISRRVNRSSPTDSEISIVGINSASISQKRETYPATLTAASILCKLMSKRETRIRLEGLSQLGRSWTAAVTSPTKDKSPLGPSFLIHNLKAVEIFWFYLVQQWALKLNKLYSVWSIFRRYLIKCLVYNKSILLWILNVLCVNDGNLCYWTCLIA